jgi:hypothetical protein
MPSEAAADTAAGGARGLRAAVDAYQRRRFAWLFASLLVTIAAGPTLDRLLPGWDLLAVLFGVNLFAAVASVAREHHLRGPVLFFATYVLTRTLLTALGVPGMLGVSDGLWAAAIAVAMFTSARYAFRSGAVDAERILAALDAYLLAGLLFGVAYALVDRAWPGSFRGVDADGLHLPRAIYFSYVTIATTGYGDVAPLSEPARGLAVVEGLGGQLYLTVLVARLVSLYAQERRA